MGDLDDEGVLPLATVKRCETCGYLHPRDGNAGADLCDRCGHELGMPLTNLFRMQNVVTRRRQRINSDEEERQRSGFELRTGVRFAEHGKRAGSAVATITDGEERLGTLTYGDTATLWRINLGWRRRKEQHKLGYVLDQEEGRWLSESALDQPADELPTMKQAHRVERVVPYVEDRRNCLIVELDDLTDRAEMLTLLAALKQGIQGVFQLEDQELAAEALPSDDEPHSLLFYEAAEGGAGVLRRLVREPDALSRVAAEALEICHFDPETGADRRRPAGAREDCEAACYDCLLSYRNQRHHQQLDRQSVVGHLLALRRGHLAGSPDAKPHNEKLQQLLDQCDSDLERDWLSLLDAHELRLPSHAQKVVSACSCRPDFLYAPDYTAVFVDGPTHDTDQARARDAEVDACLATWATPACASATTSGAPGST